MCAAKLKFAFIKDTLTATSHKLLVFKKYPGLQIILNDNVAKVTYVYYFQQLIYKSFMI